MNEKALIAILGGIFLLLLILVLRMKKSRNLPEGEWIYNDLTSDGKPTRTLYSSRYGLSGKPDMILKQGKELIPVEIKSAPGGDRPYPAHEMQLAAYCLLIGENYGIRPSHGILRYRDKQFTVTFTADLMDRLLDQLETMRKEEPEKELAPRCRNSRKCGRCGFSSICRGN